MSWMNLADLANSAVVNVFGESISYTPKSTGIAETFDAPFDEAHERLDYSGEVPTTVVQPLLDLKLDLLSVVPAVEDRFVVRSKTYEVNDVQPNGHGAVKLTAFEV